MTAENNDLLEEGPTGMSDAALLSTAKSGDADAFVELSKRHYRRVFHETYRITRNQQDAEDALQEALLNAFAHLKGFEERSSFSTWLTRIAINSALMILRKKRGCFEISMDGSDDPSDKCERWETESPCENPESSYVRRERSVAKGRNCPAAPTMPGSCGTVASKGIFNSRDCASSQYFCARGKVTPVARKIDIACRTASNRFAIRIL